MRSCSTDKFGRYFCTNKYFFCNCKSVRCFASTNWLNKPRKMFMLTSKYTHANKLVYCFKVIVWHFHTHFGTVLSRKLMARHWTEIFWLRRISSFRATPLCGSNLTRVSNRWRCPDSCHFLKRGLVHEIKRKQWLFSKETKFVLLSSSFSVHF